MNNNTSRPINETNSHAKASDFIEFQIGAYINLYYPPCLVLIGSIGNILTFMVYKKKKCQGRSSTCFLLALAVFDTIMLFIGLLQYWILFNFLPKFLTKAHCHGMFFVVNTFGNYSHWIIVCFSIDRFIKIQFPLKSRNWVTSLSARFIILVTGVVAVLKNIHFLWTTDFFYDPKTGNAICAFGLQRNQEWVADYQAFEVTISSILPFLMIAVCNILIVRRIRKNRATVSPILDQPNENISTSSSSNMIKRDKTEQSLTTILFLVSAAFILTTCPLFVFRLYHSKTDISKQTAKHQALYNLGHHICHKLWYTNNGINFFLYCLVSKSFRKDLKELVKYKGKDKPRSDERLGKIDGNTNRLYTISGNTESTGCSASKK